MLAIARIASGLLLLLSPIVTGAGRYADLDSDVGAGEIFEVLPDSSLEHYYYRPRQPPRLRLIKKPTPAKASPLQAVQKVFVAKPSPASSVSMPYTFGPIALALILQAVGTLFLLLMTKLALGIKTILITNTATLALALWSHLKKKKLKLSIKEPHKKPMKMHKKKKKKKPYNHTQWLQLTKKQVKKIMKLLSKKKKKI